MVSAFTRKLFNRLQAARPKHGVQPLHDEGVHFHPFRERQFAQLVVNRWRQIDGLLNGRVFCRAAATDGLGNLGHSFGACSTGADFPHKGRHDARQEQFYAALT